MTPQTAVACLVEILETRSEFTQDEVYQAMVDAGVPESVADRAFKFTQIAWGRVFLDGMGIKFSQDYLCFNGAGEVLESGQLADEPYFIAAMAAAKRLPPPAGLPRLALMSSVLRAVNDALNAGSKPEDLVTGPAALFMEPATPQGMKRAARMLSERVGAHKKPWWRFW